MVKSFYSFVPRLRIFITFAAVFFANTIHYLLTKKVTHGFNNRHQYTT